MLYLQLFFAFFKTGLFAVGGGMATVPFLYEMAATTDWFTEQDVANMLAVGESTPGPIGVNMATYVGYVTGGAYGLPGAILGAVTATLGLIAPSVIIILIVAMFLKNFRNNRYVEGAFLGLRPASTGLIAAAGASVAVANLLVMDMNAAGLDRINWKGILLAAALWLLTNKVKKTKKLHPIVFIIASAVLGVVFAF